MKRIASRFRWCKYALLPLFVCFFVSCSQGPRLYSVQGKVLHKGRPAKGVVVVFHPKGDKSLQADRATGVTGDDGGFELSTGKHRGAPAGTYVVTFTWPGEVESTKKEIGFTDPEARGTDRLGGQFASQEDSKFTVEVKAAANQLDPFDLK
jgi:hypothetical protein